MFRLPQLARFFSESMRKFDKQVPFDKWKIVKGDNVMLNTGPEKGKMGKIMTLSRRKNFIILEGLNMKATRIRNEEEGGYSLRSIPRPIHISNVNLVDPKIGKGTRIRIAYLKDGRKVRISKRTGTIIKKPTRFQLTYRARNKNRVDGPKDTVKASVLKLTYKGEDFGAIKRDFEKYIEEKERLEKLLVFPK